MCVVVAFSIVIYRYRQDKRMDNLTIFIDYHYKSIVSIIRVKHILTLHLFPANYLKIKLLTGSCCKNAPACYVTSTR